MKISSKTLIALIVVLLPASLFYGSNIMELRAEEPRRAIVAIEMFLSGNYLVPKINGWDYYNKPPLFNWLIVFCFHLFHSFSEWVVRFPSIVSFLLTGLFHYVFAKKYFSRQTALLASLFFLTSADIFFYATINAGEIDLFYTLLVYMQVMCIFIFYEKKNYLFLFLLSYLFTALGVLTKGPPSLAFQAITLLAWFIYNRDFKKLFGWQHILGILLCVLISGSYFYLYSQQADVVGMLVRLTKEATLRSGIESGFLKTITGTVSFPFLLFRLLLPWSVFVLFFFRKDFLQRVKENRLLTFSLLFIACNIPIYWFTGELKNRYIYMFFPFITTLIAFFFEQRENHFEKIYSAIEKLFLIAMILCACAVFVLPFISYTKEISALIPKMILFSFGAALIAFLYWKNVPHRTLLALLFMVLLRFGLDMFYYPAMMSNSPDMVYRKKAEEILSIAKGEQIFFAENPYTFNSELGVGPFKMKEMTHTTAALICYELPYYITRSNNQVMQFETEIKPGKLYITTTQFAEGKNTEVLYQLHDKWTQNELLLVRGK